MDISLADGSRSIRNCLSTICKIEIGGRTFDIQFVILPDAQHNRTILGTDFLEKAEMVLNMGQKYWFFERDPEVHFDFLSPWPLNFNLIDSMEVANRIVIPDKFQAVNAESSQR